MRSGPMARRPKRQLHYKRHLQTQKTDHCAFCDIVQNKHEDIIAVTDHCAIINNPYGYDLWDECGVEQHWLLIPRRHIVSLGELTQDEQLDYMQQVGHFADKGYSLYARAPGNVTGSVAHQHMHLIKIDNQRKNFLFYLRKPHMVVMK
ncbi:MAG: HIT domain-containing protein [Candidatus Saccharibacteria bacterium]|nr:HIT domain-containing protein [Candidatus Saccharibacteria bacterium]